MSAGASNDVASRGMRRLLPAIAAVAAVWLLLLPALLRVRFIRAHVDRLDAHHVDAGAMYYTELAPEFLLDNRKWNRPDP